MPKNRVKKKAAGKIKKTAGAAGDDPPVPLIKLNKIQLIYDQGGIGDKIMLSRFIPRFCDKYKENAIIFVVDEKLYITIQMMDQVGIINTETNQIDSIVETEIPYSFVIVVHRVALETL